MLYKFMNCTEYDTSIEVGINYSDNCIGVWLEDGMLHLVNITAEDAIKLSNALVTLVAELDDLNAQR